MFSNGKSCGVSVKLSWPLSLTVATLFLGGVGMVLAMTMNTPKPDPYTTAVLAHSGDRQRGKVLFDNNCAACHGLNGDGQVGPKIKQLSKRRNDRQIITQIVSGETPPMPRFELTPEQMADLLQYVKTL